MPDSRRFDGSHPRECCGTRGRISFGISDSYAFSTKETESRVMINFGKAVCPKCQNEFEFEYQLCVDVVVSPEASEEIVTEQFNKHPCSHCGTEISIETPLICWSDQWIAIVHAINPQARWEIGQVCLQTKHFLETTRPARSTLPTVVRAMGSIEQLRYMLKNPDCAADVRNLFQLALPHWEKEIMILPNIGNAFLDGERPDLARS